MWSPLNCGLHMIPGLLIVTVVIIIIGSRLFIHLFEDMLELNGVVFRALNKRRWRWRGWWWRRRRRRGGLSRLGRIAQFFFTRHIGLQEGFTISWTFTSVLCMTF